MEIDTPIKKWKTWILSYSGLRSTMAAVATRLVLPQRTTGVAMMRKVIGDL
jgi:hypothetical protein